MIPEVPMIRHVHRIGAVFYVLWGLLHVLAGAGMLLAGAEEQLDLLSTAPLPEAELPAALAPLVHAGLSFHGYNLLWFGLLAIGVAVLLNWRNDVTGYWVNLFVVGADDLGLVVFLILPGHLTFAEAGLGPVLFLLAAVLTTIGMVQRRREGVER